ncbi:pyruvate dehydrogenase E1 component alpha subunit [Thermocatellispora tengchongensis]|uniref:Pyruvate dehydrogenase E1 component alpha subunit n=1 Tax=Thermocatellispora tengchongensis TaxID=1073253 RepID=A0A840NXU7_9ACTN|nr:thiamine pyrophosphate-dependent dehydrogenase E1 component subunit alpha [Thermocatellispora tengchongensis]MBB5132022.1 pyruvate dehydrogenase E1 component alpha subunit [Thermocatellispora tengchongensis]
MTLKTGRSPGPRPQPPPEAPPEEEDLRLLLLIRHFELALLRLFEAGALSGTTHTCLGQEYVPVALRPLLAEDDFVFSTHRGHGHFLARHPEPHALLAEIMGREGALCAGVGGSQHIYHRRFLSTGVQGESLPVAAGVALRLAGTGALACAYIGDGTWGEGAVYEALNLAALWRLPLLVVVEHNGIAQSTPTSAQMAGTIAGRAAAFGVRHLTVRSTDLGEIRAQAGPVVAAMRAEPAPAVLEFVTHRLGPHSKGDDTRPPQEIRRAADHDWHPRLRAAYGARFDELDREQRELVERVVAEVSARPPSVWEDR